jgi:hypothetical protein
VVENRTVLRFDVLEVAVTFPVQVPNLPNEILDGFPQFPHIEALSKQLFHT